MFIIFKSCIETLDEYLNELQKNFYVVHWEKIWVNSLLCLPLFRCVNCRHWIDMHLNKLSKIVFSPLFWLLDKFSNFTIFLIWLKWRIKDHLHNFCSLISQFLWLTALILTDSLDEPVLDVQIISNLNICCVYHFERLNLHSQQCSLNIRNQVSILNQSTLEIPDDFDSSRLPT